MLLLLLLLLLLLELGSAGSALRSGGKSSSKSGSAGWGDDDPCAHINNIDTDCKCGEQPCNYCLKCGCYGCFTEAGFEMANADELDGGLRNPIQAAAIEDGRSNPE